MPAHHDFLAQPVPMGRLHDLAAGLRVAFQAGAGDSRAVRERRLEEGRVIRMYRVCWHFFPRRHCCGIRQDDAGGQQGQCGNKEVSCHVHC